MKAPRKIAPACCQQRLPALRLARADLEVLGRDPVADRARFFHRARQHQRAAAFQRRADDVAARQRRQQPLDRGADAIEIAGIGTEQDALRERVVLGLAEQVHRDPVGRRRAVGEDEDLARAGDHVDADRAEDAPLGARDVGVAGAGDLVDGGNRLRAVGERADRLRAADREQRGRRRRARRRRGRAGCARPPGRCAHGATMTISPTPATFAGIAFMSTLDGYAALPPGT